MIGLFVVNFSFLGSSLEQGLFVTVSGVSIQLYVQNDPEAGFFYNAWLEKDGNVVSLGKLQAAKGGWLLEYDNIQYSDYKNIIISLEKVNDNKLEKRILEGSFNQLQIRVLFS